MRQGRQEGVDMISFKNGLILCCLVAFFVVQCEKPKPKAQETTRGSKQTVVPFQKPTFNPPADSLITPSKLSAWIAVNPALDSLALSYRDLFRAKDAAKYQEKFMLENDRICVRFGLTGGYAEYVWILKARAYPKNKVATAAK